LRLFDGVDVRRVSVEIVEAIQSLRVADLQYAVKLR
jgi:hypothetical protein